MGACLSVAAPDQATKPPCGQGMGASATAVEIKVEKAAWARGGRWDAETQRERVRGGNGRTTLAGIKKGGGGGVGL